MGILGFDFLRAATGFLMDQGMEERNENVMDKAIHHFSEAAPAL